MDSIPEEDAYLALFKSMEGQYVGYYPFHGFELIQLEYSHQDDFFNTEYQTHKLTATKLTGDVNIPAGKITWYVEQLMKKSSVVEPIPGKGQIAQTGFKDPKFIRGSLHSLLQDKSAFQFEWDGLGSVLYIKRLKQSDSLELDSEEELNYVYKMRDYGQSLSLQSVSYLNVGGSQSLSLDQIKKLTETYVQTNEIGESCTICLLEMEKGDECCKILNCKHEFHKFCLEKWLIRSSKCPLCRRECNE